MKRIIALALLLVVAAGGYLWSMTDGESGLQRMIATVRGQFPEVPQISPAELAAWLADQRRLQPQLLDIREPREFAVSHLLGAIQVSPEANADAVLVQIDRRRPVVVYCSVGYRSSRLAQRLIAAGFTKVSNLEGSIFAWANENRPLVKDGQPARTVHPYNSVFGRLLEPEHRAR